MLYLSFPCFRHLLLLILRNLVTVASRPSHLSEFLAFLRKGSWGFDSKASFRSKTKEDTEPRGKGESQMGKSVQLGKSCSIWIWEYNNLLWKDMPQQEIVFHGADSTWLWNILHENLSQPYQSVLVSCKPDWMLQCSFASELFVVGSFLAFLHSSLWRQGSGYLICRWWRSRSVQRWPEPYPYVGQTCVSGCP